MPPSPLFVNYGGAMQLRLESAEDLMAIATLDEPFWMATSAPTHQLALDPALLRRLDRDSNGRILSQELRQAIAWLLCTLQDHGGINAASRALTLEAFNRGDPDGERLSGWAQAVLTALGRPDGRALSLEDVRLRRATLMTEKLNGDGVLPLDAVEGEAARALAADILALIGEAPDLSGAPGVDAALLERFLDEGEALLKWQDRAESGGAQMFPLGEATASASVALSALLPELRAYFEICRLVAVGAAPEGLTAGRLLKPEEALSREARRALIATLPLAAPRADAILDLRSDLNPFRADALKNLDKDVFTPLLGEGYDGTLSEAQLELILDRFALFHRWQEDGRGNRLETLGPERLRAHLRGPGLPELRGRMEQDLAARPELMGLEDLEHLILLQATALRLCRNFVSFPDLYDPTRRAMFELGTLILDGRRFNFNLKVRDIKAHSAAAERSGIFLLYSEVTGSTSGEMFSMVTPVTAGRRGPLSPDKRGVLFDREGREWDVRVVQIVKNPVSLLEAFLMPFRAIAERLGKTPERLTTTAQQEVDAALDHQIKALNHGVKGGIGAGLTSPSAVTPARVEATPAPTPKPAPKSAGIKEAALSGSVAIAALSSSFAFVAKTVVELEWEKVMGTLLVTVALIGIPLLLVAAWRMRRRNLSAILEASGWALNEPMYLSLRLGRAMTVKPKRPKGIKSDTTDLLPRA